MFISLHPTLHPTMISRLLSSMNMCIMSSQRNEWERFISTPWLVKWGLRISGKRKMQHASLEHSSEEHSGVQWERWWCPQHQPGGQIWWRNLSPCFLLGSILGISEPGEIKQKLHSQSIAMTLINNLYVVLYQDTHFNMFQVSELPWSLDLSMAWFTAHEAITMMMKYSAMLTRKSRVAAALDAPEAMA